MTEKYGETSLSGSYRLALDIISKASANQRCGRVGRTRPGFCYRMCNEVTFSQFIPQRRPEILRIPLHNIVIKVVRTGLDPAMLFEDFLKGLAFDERLKIQSSYVLLKFLGMINKNNRITKMGTFATEFTLSVRNTAILWHWIKEGLPIFPATVVLSMIDCFGPSYFYYPRNLNMSGSRSFNADSKKSGFSAATLSGSKTIRTEGEAQTGSKTIRMEGESTADIYEKYFSKYNDETDLGVLLNIWRDLFSILPSLDVRLKTLHTITKWSIEHMMNNKKIIEMFRAVYYSGNTLRNMGYEITASPFTNAGCIGHLTPILRRVYSDKIFVKGNLGQYIPKFRSSLADGIISEKSWNRCRRKLFYRAKNASSNERWTTFRDNWARNN
jgi:HrpA-like RNA helicase